MAGTAEHAAENQPISEGPIRPDHFVARGLLLVGVSPKEVGQAIRRMEPRHPQDIRFVLHPNTHHIPLIRPQLAGTVMQVVGLDNVAIERALEELIKQFPDKESYIGFDWHQIGELDTPFEFVSQLQRVCRQTATNKLRATLGARIPKEKGSLLLRGAIWDNSDLLWIPSERRHQAKKGLADSLNKMLPAYGAHQAAVAAAEAERDVLVESLGDELSLIGTAPVNS